MTYTANHPVDGDDIQTALSTYVNQNLTHIVAAINQEHVWSNSDATATVHDYSLFSTKVGYTSQDISSTDDLVVSGLGFKPQVVLLVTIGKSQAGNIVFSVGGATATGASNAALAYVIDSSGTLAASGSTTYISCIVYDGATLARATLKSMDSGGFTLAWAKSGSPTGAAHIFYVALRFSPNDSSY